MNESTPFEEVARQVAAGKTEEAPAEPEAPADEAPPSAESSDLSAAADAQEPTPEKEPAPKRRGRNRKAPAPRQRKRKTTPERELPPTPIAEAGIPEKPDPTAPFPGQREAEPDPEPATEPIAVATPAESGNGAAPPEPAATRVYTALDDVPPDEEDPLKRDGVTYETVEPEEGMQFPDQSGGRKPPANLTDVCREYRLGQHDSDCYIRVERKKPAQWQGIGCAGFLGNIRAPITEGEFKDLVGGGTYELVVYGPDPRGKPNPYTGTTEIKALTKPIVAHHPGRPKFVDLDAVFEAGGDDENEDPRRNNMSGGFGWSAMEGRRGIPGRGEVTSADAKIHQDSLTFAQKELQEQRRELKEARDEARLNAKKDDGATPAYVRAIESAARQGVEAVKETAETTKAMLERQLEDKDRALEELRRELREMRTEEQSRPRSDNAAWGAFAEMSKAALAGRGSSGEDTARLHDAHQREMDRLHEAHKRELESMRQRYDEVVKAKDAEMERTRTLYQERERDLRQEFERREKTLRDEGERREKQLDERYRDRIDSMEKEHLRQLEAVKRQEELIRETHKSSYETKLTVAEERARAAKEEAERAREEAANKEDFVGQMEKIQAQAEFMGYSKGSEAEPKDWKERLAAAVGNALESAPNIFDSATKTFQARQEAMQASVHAMRAAQAPPPQRQLPQQRRPPQQQRGPNQAPAQRRFWSSQDGLPFESNASRPPEAPPRPEQRPPPAADPNAQQAQPSPQPQSQFQPPEAPPQAPPQPPRQQPVEEAEGIVHQPSDGNAGGLPIDPGMLNQLRLMLEGSFGMGVPPADFASAFAQEIGVEQLKLVITGMTADSVLDALSEHPEGASSPLLGREGRNWFRGVWSEGARIVGV